MGPQPAAPTANVPEGANTEPFGETKRGKAKDAPEGGVLEPPKEKQTSKSEDVAEERAAEPEPPFSIFSRSEKTFIVIIVSLAALFSPLSANIYYPALNVLAKDLNVSSTLINLTVTSYLVRRGITYTVMDTTLIDIDIPRACAHVYRKPIG